jgi:flagellar hook-basal body complex protein FliE
MEDRLSLATGGIRSSIGDLAPGAATERVRPSGALPQLEESGGEGSVIPAFGEVLSGFLQQVDAAQHRSDAMVESLALGEPVDVHQVMLALGEASNALHLTLQVRGKALEAYQELMRLPI